MPLAQHGRDCGRDYGRDYGNESDHDGDGDGGDRSAALTSLLLQPRAFSLLRRGAFLSLRQQLGYMHGVEA